jgi:hypothetical protein
MPISAAMRSRRRAPCSWTLQESQVESCEYQDNADIHGQSFPEPTPEEQEIYTDNDGCHQHDIKHDSYLPVHFGLGVNRNPLRWGAFWVTCQPGRVLAARNARNP